MPTLTVLPLNKSVEAKTGATILQSLLDGGVDHLHKCGGNAKCGTCHIFVHDGRKSLSKVQRLENEKLDSIVGVGSKSRLACQAVIGEENVTIELLGFASGL
jgi:2Fe-2S ferredoxin